MIDLPTCLPPVSTPCRPSAPSSLACSLAAFHSLPFENLFLFHSPPPPHASPLSSCSTLRCQLSCFTSSPSVTLVSSTFLCLPSFPLRLLLLPPFHCNSSALTLTPSYILQSPSSYFYIHLFLFTTFLLPHSSSSFPSYLSL